MDISPLPDSPPAFERIVRLPDGVMITYLLTVNGQVERARLHRTHCGHANRRVPRSPRRRRETTPTLALLREANPTPCDKCHPDVKLGELTADPVLIALDEQRAAEARAQSQRMQDNYDRVMGSPRPS